jgi:hypothetical protein
MLQTIREGNKKEVRDERGEEKDIVGSSNGSLQERPTSWICWAAERAIIHQQDWNTTTYLGGKVKSEGGDGVHVRLGVFFDVSFLAPGGIHVYFVVLCVIVVSCCVFVVGTLCLVALWFCSFLCFVHSEKRGGSPKDGMGFWWKDGRQMDG